MKKLCLTLVVLLVLTDLIACSCSQSFGNNFLNQAKDFDAIVIGEFHRNAETSVGYFLIEKVLKGSISSDTILIHEGGTDCTEVFLESNPKLILGLYQETSQENSKVFSVPSCVTSVLYAIDDVVTSRTDFYSLHVRSPRIGIFSKEMKLKKFERKMNRL